MARVAQYILGLMLALAFSFAIADWRLESNGRNGIFTEDASGHQLSIVENLGSVDFFLSLADVEFSRNPAQAVFRLRRLSEKSRQLELVDNRPGRRTYLVGFDPAQKTRLMNRMISELAITIEIVTPSPARLELEFSLAGFTVGLNDFLILRETGSLDYQQLHENGRDKELICLYAADIYVRSVLGRFADLSLAQMLGSIPRTHIEVLDDITGEMVDNVFGIPSDRLPRDPRAEKYGIFKACRERAG